MVAGLISILWKAAPTPLERPCTHCETAGIPAPDAAYSRGAQYLLKTQQEDGSWYVRTRAMALQPYFDAGFPHNFDQWISAAGSAWATLALLPAQPPQIT